MWVMDEASGLCRVEARPKGECSPGHQECDCTKGQTQILQSPPLAPPPTLAFPSCPSVPFMPFAEVSLFAPGPN